MKVSTISFAGTKGAYISLAGDREGAGDSLVVPSPVECRFLDGTGVVLPYASVQKSPKGSVVAAQEWSHHGYIFTLTDRWSEAGEGRAQLERRVRVEGQPASEAGEAGNGFQLHLAVRLAGSGEPWQFFSPAMHYSPDQHTDDALVTFNDDRLAYPLVAAYQPSSRRAVCLSRVSLPHFDSVPRRTPGEQRYLHSTDTGSTGFSRERGATTLHLFWPYYEGETSALLNARGSDASAFYPLDGFPLDVVLRYEVFAFEAPTYADAVLAAFKNACTLARPAAPQLPFSLQDAIEYRLTSAAKTYSEWGDGGAGFILNFDPERGYNSQAKAFGASFTTHDTNDSHSILEYGFTGRQLNLAYTLAEARDGEWLERGSRVADYFVDQLATPSGWLYTLYHLDKKGPLYTVGDPDGPVMHYLARSEEPGNYTRMMVEAAGDLLLNYRLHRLHGKTHEKWLATCLRFADFLVACQSTDGSWFRAYNPACEPLRSGTWFGATEGEGKSATAIPVRYLLAVAQEVGDRAGYYIGAARKACEYVLREQVANDNYRGGTLDNPNVVDKEAAMLAMAALLDMHSVSGEQKYLLGAERAAKLAVTWNSIWNVPLVPGTRVQEAGVQSTGWGGINSIWGAGVTDIYSLFFLAELVRLSRLTGEPLYEEVADLVAHGTQQILSYPGDSMGFADVGMQPEGISFCNQGVDDGLIAKGDIWGGLGWIYTAGTFGLSRYLQEMGR